MSARGKNGRQLQKSFEELQLSRGWGRGIYSSEAVWSETHTTLCFGNAITECWGLDSQLEACALDVFAF